MESNYSVQVGDCITSSSSSYIVLKILGSGSYGDVVLCHKTSNNQLVALKVLKYGDDGEMEARTLQMLREMDSGSHNIIQCMDSFQFKGYYCHEFENLDISLMELLETCPYQSLPLKHIRPIIAQMARALGFLKTAGIAHCDLKPENIMLIDHVMQPLCIRIIDFGLACPVKEFVPGTMVQTFYYRAPEVQVGSPITESADMWSVGCIAAEMFLGETLFCASNDSDLLSHVIEIVGQPPKHVLDSGKLTQYYFRCCKGSAGWIHQKICSEFNNPLTIASLDDIINFNSAQMMSAAETWDCSLFVDLLKRMLDVDPERRITPEDVLKHPFITMNPMKQWFPSYYSTSQKIMAQVMSFSSEGEQQCASTSSSQVTVVAETTKDAQGVKPSQKRSREEDEQLPQKRVRQEGEQQCASTSSSQITVVADMAKDAQLEKPSRKRSREEEEQLPQKRMRQEKDQVHDMHPKEIEKIVCNYEVPLQTTTSHHKKCTKDIVLSCAAGGRKRKHNEEKCNDLIFLSPPLKKKKY